MNRYLFVRISFFFLCFLSFYSCVTFEHLNLSNGKKDSVSVFLMSKLAVSKIDQEGHTFKKKHITIEPGEHEFELIYDPTELYTVVSPSRKYTDLRFELKAGENYMLCYGLRESYQTERGLKFSKPYPFFMKIPSEKIAKIFPQGFQTYYSTELLSDELCAKESAKILQSRKESIPEWNYFGLKQIQNKVQLLIHNRLNIEEIDLFPTAQFQEFHQYFIDSGTKRMKIKYNPDWGYSTSPVVLDHYFEKNKPVHLVCLDKWDTKWRPRVFPLTPNQIQDLFESSGLNVKEKTFTVPPVETLNQSKEAALCEALFKEENLSFIKIQSKMKDPK
ncbi:hypothetical protein EHQ76_10590 [Leptospira barantonii]|uniref:Lipoprotein n=1 Tax=Leptospira barantonii TaxID=2023184 RepID=A0A5F2B668_9LEPT|nr:hypothetical protein [Leptospira barantonii]TGM01081.1 hypothetical protein EHQ76_10590 [Leptospira barantonii]